MYAVQFPSTGRGCWVSSCVHVSPSFLKLTYAYIPKVSFEYLLLNIMHCRLRQNAPFCERLPVYTAREALGLSVRLGQVPIPIYTQEYTSC